MTNQQSGLSNDAQAMMAFQSGKKSVGIAYVFWFFLGGVGGHRFYLGESGTAAIMLVMSIMGWLLLLAGGIGLFLLIPLVIWLLVDLFLIPGMAEKKNAALIGQLNTMSRSQRAPTSAVDELAKFAALRDSGAISDEEYEAQKRRLIGGPAKEPAA